MPKTSIKSTTCGVTMESAQRYAVDDAPLRCVPEGAPPTSARAARRSRKMQREVSAWWATLAPGARRAHYTGAQLAQLVGQPITLLGPGLLALGWRREVVRLNVDQQALWLPPSAPSIKRPVGRPSFAQLAQGVAS